MLRRVRQRWMLALHPRETPNPHCLAYEIPGRGFESFVPEGIVCEVSHRGMSDVHPLTNSLFEQYEREVSSVFLTPRCVSITKFEAVEWRAIDWSLSSFLGHYLLLGQCVEPRALYLHVDDDTKALEGDSEVTQCVKELVKTQVRPMVQRDGGDVRLVRVNEATGVVAIAMLGACRTCPSSRQTLKDGIERTLRHFVPEIREVVQVQGEEAHLNFELCFPNEAALRREAGRVDLQRQRRIRPPSSGGLLSFEHLMEPDGD